MHCGTRFRSGRSRARWSSCCATTATCCSRRRCSRALKAQAPQREIDALVYDDTAPMLEGHPGARAAAVVGRNWKKAGFLSRLASGTAALRRAARAPLRPDRAPHRAAARRLARALAGRALQRRAGGARARRVLGAELHAPLSAARATAAATRSRPTSMRCGASACSRAWRSGACSFVPGAAARGEHRGAARRRRTAGARASSISTRRRAGASSAGPPSAMPS